MRAQGAEKFCAALAADAVESQVNKEESFMDLIRDQCFKKNDINISYRWDT